MNDLPLLRSLSQMQSRIRSWRAFGETVALVPVGAALHEGHLGVLQEAGREADRVLAVVMPAHGATDPPEEEARLADRADEAGAAALFLPPAEALRPADAATELRLPGFTDVLCGEDRPDELPAFALAMARLLNRSQADAVVMGELDWQRIAILRRLAADLGLAAQIRAAPTARGDDEVACGPAEALGGEDRKAAARLWRELRRAAGEIAAGADADATLDAAADALSEAGAEVEYLEMRDSETLAEVTAPDAGGAARLFAAVSVGGLRLIDNVPVERNAGV